MPFPIVPVLAGLFSVANTLIANRGQKNVNTNAFGMSAAQEQKIFERDAAYNSPEAQMARLRAAGLSPHLMYGQGTVGNTSGNAVQMQPYQVRDAGQVPAQVAQAFAVEKQVKLRDSEIRLKAAQEELVRANPYLSPTYIDSMVQNMRALADIKMKERDILTTKEWYDEGDGTLTQETPMSRKIRTDIDLLVQRFNLGKLDAKVKAEIIQSKEFENALKKIQVEWMESGEVTPQHIYQAILMMLGKFK